VTDSYKYESIDRVWPQGGLSAAYRRIHMIKCVRRIFLYFRKLM
jgi:hypothetical protein